MSLPFLPLKPTGAPVGTPMDEALGQPDMAIIRTILANIRAGDEEGAQEEACRAVDSWLATAKLHSRNLKAWVVPDEELWAKLVRNVFPNAPHPPTTLDPPMTNREWFYAMCQRYRDLREFREISTVEPLAAFKAAQEASWEQYRRLLAIRANSPIRERRKDAWKRAKLRAYRLWKALPLLGRARTAQLRFLEQRLTEWEPFYYSIYFDEEVYMDVEERLYDNGEFSRKHGGPDPEYNTPEDDPLFYFEYDGSPPWLPQS